MTLTAHHTPMTTPAATPLTLFSLFAAFLKAGGLTIGDGYAAVAPLRRTLVKQNGWMDADGFESRLAVAQAMPGVFNMNFAVYIGHALKGWKGGAAALAGMTLPPVLLLLLISTFFDTLRSFAPVEAFLRGARPAIVALVLLPALQMLRSRSVSLSTVWIPIGAALAIALLGVSPSYIILGLTLAAVLYALLVRPEGK